MQAIFKTLLVLVIAVPLAICAGYLTGDDDHDAVVGIIGGIVCLGAYFLLGRGIRPEAFALTVLLCVYYVCGKAAAVVTLGGPLFLGEVVLSFTILCFILRFALTREPVVWTNLSGPLLVLLVYSGIHLWFDYRSYGLLAIRDSAVSYYALFFFFGLSISNHPPSADFLMKWVQWAIVVACLFVHPPITFLGTENRFEISGRILVAHTSDTVGASYLFASVVLYLKARRTEQFKIMFYWLSAGCLLSAALQGRSTFTLATFVMMAYIWKTGAKGYAIGTTVAALIALVLSTAAIRTGFLDQDSGRLGYVAGHMASLTEQVVSTKQEHESASLGESTMEWRLTWWKYLADETWKQDPLFGLGFGRDITSGFIDAYAGPTYSAGEEYGVRSPHSVFFTYLGRTGLLGAAIFLVVVAAFLIKLKDSTEMEWNDRDRAAWCLVLVIFVSAFFSVVFEGPNGAIPFWLYLGILSGKMAKRRVDSIQAKRKLQPGLVRSRHHRPELQPAFS